MKYSRGYHSYYGVYFWELIKRDNSKMGAELKASKPRPLQQWFYRERDRQKRGAVAGMAADKKLGKQQQDWINYPYQSTKHTADDIVFLRCSRCRIQVVSSNLPMLLHFEDRDSMAFSIEGACAFSITGWRSLSTIFLHREDQQWHYQIGIAQGHARRAACKVLNRKDKMVL